MLALFLLHPFSFSLSSRLRRNKHILILLPLYFFGFLSNKNLNYIDIISRATTSIV